MSGKTNLIAGREILVVVNSAPLHPGSTWNCQLNAAEKLHSRNTNNGNGKGLPKGDFFPTQLSSDCIILTKFSNSFDELIALCPI